MNSEIIVLKDVWKSYLVGEVDVPVLKGINISIDRGDFVAIIGASGSGKSTMMNIIGCLDTPSKGEVYLNSVDISKYRDSNLAKIRSRTIGFIFQQYNLIPTLNALENVLLPLEVQEITDDISGKRSKELLKRLGLEHHYYKLPKQMSGGQQQRVAIARCLAANPEIILADEPTGALDSVTGNNIMSMLNYMWKNARKTIIMVTHNLDLARYARTVIEIKDGSITNIRKK